MSAQVTEAHRELARTIRLHLTLGQAYQLIADSEARAVAEIAMVAAASADRNVSLRLERDQLRAECLNLRADLDAIKAIRNEETARAERAEADLATEQAKVRVLRDACESICEEWGRNHDAPFCAGSEMEKHASRALEKLEEAT